MVKDCNMVMHRHITFLAAVIVTSIKFKFVR